jgi:hypothetical protein
MRTVEHIEVQPKGYMLTLRCGHHEWRPARKLALIDLFRLGVDRAIRRITAPYRVRCLLCGLAGEKTDDPPTSEEGETDERDPGGGADPLRPVPARLGD